MAETLYFENPRRGRGGRFVKGKRRRKARKNPTRRRRERRSGGRRRATRRRASRRRNPVALVNPRRRRRARRSSGGRRRYSRRGGGRRRNPSSIFDTTSTMKHNLNTGVGLVVGDFLGDVGVRAIQKWAPNLASKLPVGYQGAILRVGVGLFAAGLVRKLTFLPRAWRSLFAPVNVAVGLSMATQKPRTNVMHSMGLADYELADYELAGYGNAPPPGVLGDEYNGPPAGVLGDYELAGDYSDQDYYGNYG